MRAAIAWLGRLLLVFCVVEGVASVARFVLVLATQTRRPFAERAHTEYDAELGWVNRPNVSLPDLYGPGASLHTDAQRFRGARDVEPHKPAGRVRVVCSGDSFALGYGVGDDATWCHQLESLEPHVESVNMGQGGYGLDQSYLWFLRDGAPLEHDIHLFSFIVEDFVRMGVTSFFGYGKPRLRLDGDRLVAENVPVPRGAYWLPWLYQNAHFADELRSVALLRAVADRAGGGTRTAAAGDDVGRLAAAVFADLARLHRAAGRTLVLLYLPMRDERTDDRGRALRDFVAREAARLGVPFLDGAAKLRERDPSELDDLYITQAAVDFPAAAGHFTERGNRWTASWIVEALRENGTLPRAIEATSLR